MTEVVTKLLTEVTRVSMRIKTEKERILPRTISRKHLSSLPPSHFRLQLSTRMNSSILPAPLHLRPRTVKPVSPQTAHSLLSEFLSSDSSSLLSGSGAVRASLVRLAQGLKDELDAPVLEVAKEEDSNAGEKKKRRKSEKGVEAEAKKRRKVEA